MFYIGVDIGGMSIKCGLVGEDGKIIDSLRAVTPLDTTDNLIAVTAKLVEDIIQKNSISKNEIYGVGVGVPGIVDTVTGEVKYSCNLFKQTVSLKDELQKALSLDVRVANDADCAAFGETLFGGAKGAQNVILVTIGTGVGGGVVADGKLFSGGRGMGGEIGHMGIGGVVKCACGRYGCFETESSATALIRKTQKGITSYPDSTLAEQMKKDGKVDGTTIFKAMKAGCGVAKEIYASYVETLGYGLVNLANIFRPEVILIGGGISAEGEILTEPLQNYVDEHLYGGTEFAPVKVGVATLGNDAGIIGAGFLLRK